MKIRSSLIFLIIFCFLYSCEKEQIQKPENIVIKEHKKVIYQVFTPIVWQ